MSIVILPATKMIFFCPSNAHFMGLKQKSRAGYSPARLNKTTAVLSLRL